MNEIHDVVIVGAGPVGIYLGMIFAKKNHSVLIVEKNSKENTGSKMDQFHLETMVFDKYGIPPPIEGTDEFIKKFKWTSYYGPYGKYQQVMNYPVTAMRFQFFIQRLIKLAEEEGVTFQFNSSFKEIISKEKMVCKFWIESIMLANNYGISSKDLNRIRKVIQSYLNIIKEAWNEHCG